MKRTTMLTRTTYRMALTGLSLFFVLPVACNLNGVGGVVAETLDAQTGAPNTGSEAPPGTGGADARSRGDALDPHRHRRST